jgi:hypothetical protein
MTEKENFMKMVRGEHPEWVPVFSFINDPTRTVPTMKIGSRLLFDHHFQPGISHDIWGVPYESSASAGMQKLPQPNHYILDDIRKWRDVIKAPDLSGIDWEMMAKKDIEAAKIDRSQTALIFKIHYGYFQTLMSFMGFEEGLCAMYEEPEEVKALLEYLCDFYMDVCDRCMKYYEPDMICLTDDIATSINPFFSLDMYRDLIKPFHARQCKLGTDNGIPMEVHCCGRCEDFIDDYISMGITAWDPAQPVNDLVGIKKKYGRSFAIIGGWTVEGELASPDCSEETVRQKVRNLIDMLAPDGGYSFYGSFLVAVGDEANKRKNAWMTDEAVRYGKKFYLK